MVASDATILEFFFSNTVNFQDHLAKKDRESAEAKSENEKKTQRAGKGQRIKDRPGQSTKAILLVSR